MKQLHGTQHADTLCVVATMYGACHDCTGMGLGPHHRPLRVPTSTHTGDVALVLERGLIREPDKIYYYI